MVELWLGWGFDNILAGNYCAVICNVLEINERVVVHILRIFTCCVGFWILNCLTVSGNFKGKIGQNVSPVLFVFFRLI